MKENITVSVRIIISTSLIHAKLPSFLPSVFLGIYQKIPVLKSPSTSFPSGENYSNQEDYSEENYILIQLCYV